MKEFLSSAQAAEWVNELASHRDRFAAATTQADRADAALAVAERCWALGWAERSAFWLNAVGPLPEETSVTNRFRTLLLTVEMALDRSDLRGAARVAEQLRALSLSLPEQEAARLASLVRLALSTKPAEPFAAFERAFRFLRAHPLPQWSARFYAWRAEWQQESRRDEEASASWKRALAEASKSEPALEAAVQLAYAAAQTRTKALRAAQMAVRLAGEHGLPEARRDAQLLVSQWAAPREAVSELLGALETARLWDVQRAAWERQARAADSGIFEELGRERRRKQDEALAQITARLAEERDLSRALDGLYGALRTLMPADIFGIALLTPDGRSLDYALFVEDGRRTRVGLIPIDSTRSLGAWCFRERRAVRVDDIDQEYALYLKELSRLSEHRPKAMVFHPLLTESGARGIITAQSFLPRAYTAESEAQLAVLAACVSLRLQAGYSAG